MTARIPRPQHAPAPRPATRPAPAWERHRLFQEPVYENGQPYGQDDTDDDGES